MVAGLVFTEFEWTTHFGFLPLVGFACRYFFYYKIADFGFLWVIILFLWETAHSLDFTVRFEVTINVMLFCQHANVYIEFICIIARTLSMFPREDVLLILAQGSVQGNTVPRDSIDTYAPGSRESIGYYDLC